MSQSRAVLVFSEDRQRLAKAFMRPQEHYDSPAFRNKIFTNRDARDWCKKVLGGFTYYEDWAGFNLPSRTLAPFYGGRFDPLNREERALLSLLKQADGHEYVIAAAKGESFGRIVKHEYGHVLFHFVSEYREEALQTLRAGANYQILRKILKKLYHPAVIDDEIIAYAVSGTYEWLGLADDHVFWKIESAFHNICLRHFGFSLKHKAASDLFARLNVVEL